MNSHLIILIIKRKLILQLKLILTRLKVNPKLIANCFF